MEGSPFRIGIRTDTGTQRTLNEDTAQVVEFHPGDDPLAPPVLLAVVADGMGGHAAGEVASQLAVATLIRVIQEEVTATHPDEQQLNQALTRAFTEANAEVYACGQTAETHGMGTTMTAALATERHLCIGHIGDSRAYLIRRGKISQLTRDHTVVQQKLDAGILTLAEAAASEERHQLIRAVGTRPEVVSDLRSQQIQAGDVVILASDGLHNSQHAAALLAAAKTAAQPQLLCDQLVTRAREADGTDNISIVSLQVEDGRQLQRRRRLLHALLGVVSCAIVLVLGLLIFSAHRLFMPAGVASPARKSFTLVIDTENVTVQGTGYRQPSIAIGGDLQTVRRQWTNELTRKYPQHITFNLEETPTHVIRWSLKRGKNRLSRHNRGISFNGDDPIRGKSKGRLKGWPDQVSFQLDGSPPVSVEIVFPAEKSDGSLAATRR